MAALRVAILAMENISPIHLAIPCCVFADRHPGGPEFEAEVCAARPGPLPTTAGFSLSVTAGLDSLDRADLIVAPSWPAPDLRPDPDLVRRLQAAYSRGAIILGLCLGAYVLAYAGLLDEREATTHWAFADDFRTRFPKVRLNAEALYAHAGPIWTSAGVAAGFDCCLAFIRDRFGGEKANAIARNIVVAPHRAGGQAQFVEAPLPRSLSDERLSQVLDQARRSLDAPHTIDSLASAAGMSRRSFTRRLQAQTGATFGAWLLRERLRLSQTLLEASSLSVEAIAARAGFGSAAALRLHFGRAFGVSPHQWRRAFAADRR